MLEDEIMCDVTLLAGPTKEQVRCHKFILASRSSVLFTMFCGSLPETSDVIAIPDIEAGTMKQFIRFLYTGEAKLTAGTVMSLMYAAQKYDVANLREQCTTFLKDNLSVGNVCVTLDHALHFGEEELKKQCLEFITENATEVLASEEFCHLTREALQMIVKIEDLRSTELSLYQGCKRWAKAVCDTNDQEPTDQNIREVFGGILFLIGFASMTVKEFCENVANESILSKSEVVDVYQDIITHSKTSAFSAVCRSMSKKKYRIQRGYDFGDNWIHQGKLDGISFNVSRPAYLVAISCYLPSTNGRTEGYVDIFEEKSLVISQNISLVYKHRDIYTDVNLNKKVRLIPGKIYSVCQRLTGQPTYCFQKHSKQRTVSDKDITVEFMNLLPVVGTSNNKTTATRGQFHALLLDW